MSPNNLRIISFSQNFGRFLTIAPGNSVFFKICLKRKFPKNRREKSDCSIIFTVQLPNILTESVRNL